MLSAQLDSADKKKNETQSLRWKDLLTLDRTGVRATLQPGTCRTEAQGVLRPGSPACAVPGAGSSARQASTRMGRLWAGATAPAEPGHGELAKGGVETWALSSAAATPTPAGQRPARRGVVLETTGTENAATSPATSPAHEAASVPLPPAKDRMRD